MSSFPQRGETPDCRHRRTAEFGDRLCFWGSGCDTQQLQQSGTPEEVYEHTRRAVEILRPGGGLVFCQKYNIQANVPPESIVAVCDAVHHKWQD